MLLPPDLRAWVPDDPIVHFINDAIDALRLDEAKVNARGTGSAQYPPSMMLGLFIYSLRHRNVQQPQDRSPHP